MLLRTDSTGEQARIEARDCSPTFLAFSAGTWAMHRSSQLGPDTRQGRKTMRDEERTGVLCSRRRAIGIEEGVAGCWHI